MRKAIGDLPQHTPAFTGHVPKWSGLRACTTLAACGLRLGRLRCLSHLREYFANGFVGPWAALFSPGLQPLDLFFEIREEVWAAEHRAPRPDYRLDLFPHDPLLPVAFEEEVFVDEPAVHDARHHLPITEHHAHVRVFPATGRTDSRHFLHAFHMEIGAEPLARFAQSGLPPLLEQPQHQIHLLVRYFSHVSSFGLDCRFVFRGTSFMTAPFVSLFRRNLFTTSAVNPPVDITLPAISTALLMQNGHIGSSSRGAAVHRERFASARFRTPSWICPQPFVTPFRWSSSIRPSAECRNWISVPPSTSLKRYWTFETTG